MRYSTEPKYKKYLKGYSFLSFARRFGDKCGKKLMDTAEATGDLMGNKIADKTTSLDKIKSKEIEDEIKEI